MKRSVVPPAAAGLFAALCVWGVGLATASPSAAREHGAQTHGAQTHGAQTHGAQTDRAQTGTKARSKPAGADLLSYKNCAQLLDHVKAEALKEVGPYGLSGSLDRYPGFPPVGVVRGVVPVPTALGANPTAATPPSTAASSASTGSTGTGSGNPGYSTTNDQEAGVDEPDMVKTDGQVMVVLRQDPLGVQVVDVSGSSPRLEGFLPLPQLEQASGLFLAGQDIYVIGDETSGPVPVRYLSGTAPTAHPGSGPKEGRPMPQIVAPPLPWRGGAPSTDVVVVSVADPQTPEVVRTFSFRGQDQGARLINGQVVLALTNEPGLAWAYPATGTAAAKRAATAANKAEIESSKASDWLPSETEKEGDGHQARTLTRPASCGRTYHTAIDSGLGTVSLVSLDPATASPGTEVTVIGNAQNVYASATALYVATTNWQDQGGWGCPYTSGVACPMEPAYVVPPSGLKTTTDIYGFDISNPSSPHYIGSGSVPGTLIGQYAMSEFDGYLRVATTRGEPTPAPVDGGAAPPRLSDNMVSVLQDQAGALITVGTLHGLGRGEKIYAVRFVGDLGYVVTFNQTDPLFVVDLTNPDRPVLAGQVSLSGYSSFLQPLSGSLLLGIGQAVDRELRIGGLQLEVFDVAQPGRPTLVSRQQLGSGASSAAEYDPHALLWWPAADLLVLPVDDYSGAVASSSSGVWSVGSSGTLRRVGALSQPRSSPQGYPEIERAVVVGGDIYTLSEQGVMVSDMSSLSRVAWLAYHNASS